MTGRAPTERFASLDRARWQAAQPLLAQALELEPGARTAFLDRALFHDFGLPDHLPAGS